MNKTAARDTDFEQSFFQLAYEQLQDKLFNLLPFMIGFEVVKKNEDNTKALGVFGFQSNSGQMLFVPVFFINGEIKGLDILYSKNNEQFFPLNEDFASFFLKDNLAGVGGPTGQTREAILADSQGTDLRDLIQAPRTGRTVFASVLEDVQDGKAFQKEAMGLLDYVKAGDNRTKKAFQTLLEKDANYLEGVLRFYTLDKVAEAIAPLGSDYKKDTQVEVIYPKDKDKAQKLTDKERADLMTQGFFISDKRKEDGKSEFGAINYRASFSNPTCSGFFSYLTNTGGLNYGLVLNRPQQLQQNFVTDDAIVINLDGTAKPAYVSETKGVFVKDQVKVNDYSEIHKLMVEPAEGKPSFDKHYVLINENLEASVPFTIIANYKDPSDIRKIQVEAYSQYDYDGDSHGKTDRPGSIHNLPRGNFYDHPKKKNKFTLVMTKRPGDKLERNGELVFVPKGFKLLAINLRPDYAADCCGQCVSVGSDDEKAEDRKKAKQEWLENKPGNLSVLNRALTERSIFPMTVRSNGSEYFVDVPEARKKYENALDAKIGMVIDYGLDKQAAFELIDSLVDGVTVKGLYKKAYTGDSSPELPIPEEWVNMLGQPEAGTYTVEQPQPVDQSYTGDPTRLGLGVKPDTDGAGPGLSGAVQNATQLAQSGQKELFDTQSIATLAKYVDPTSKVKDYMPDFISTLDKLGRMLFLVYWETEKFEELYGRTELPDIVELLTNVFKNLGDLVLILKRKSPEVSLTGEKEQLGV